MTINEPLAPSPEPARVPVFVDATGRRAAHIRRLATLVVLGCLGYGMALLIAALTGVPIEGAIVPYPAIGAHPHSNRPADSPGVGPSGGSATSGPTTSTSRSASATPLPASARPSAHATPTPSAHPTAAATATHPTTSATATPTHGKSTSAPGATRRPTSRPTAVSTHSRLLRP